MHLRCHTPRGAVWALFVATGVTLSSGVGGTDARATPAAAPAFSEWSPPVNLGAQFNTEYEESAPMPSTLATASAQPITRGARTGVGSTRV